MINDSLIAIIADTIQFGYIVTFKREVNNISIVVVHERTLVRSESWLPLDDHLEKVGECINFMVMKLREKVNEYDKQEKL